MEENLELAATGPVEAEEAEEGFEAGRVPVFEYSGKSCSMQYTRGKVLQFLCNKNHTDDKYTRAAHIGTILNAVNQYAKHKILINHLSRSLSSLADHGFITVFPPKSARGENRYSLSLLAVEAIQKYGLVKLDKMGGDLFKGSHTEYGKPQKRKKKAAVSPEWAAQPSVKKTVLKTSAPKEEDVAVETVYVDVQNYPIDNRKGDRIWIKAGDQDFIIEQLIKIPEA